MCPSCSLPPDACCGHDKGREGDLLCYMRWQSLTSPGNHCCCHNFARIRSPTSRTAALHRALRRVYFFLPACRARRRPRASADKHATSVSSRTARCSRRRTGCAIHTARRLLTAGWWPVPRACVLGRHREAGGRRVTASPHADTRACLEGTRDRVCTAAPEPMPSSRHETGDSLASLAMGAWNEVPDHRERVQQPLVPQRVGPVNQRGISGTQP